MKSSYLHCSLPSDRIKELQNYGICGGHQRVYHVRVQSVLLGKTPVFQHVEQQQAVMSGRSHIREGGELDSVPLNAS